MRLFPVLRVESTRRNDGSGSIISAVEGPCTQLGVEMEQRFGMLERNSGTHLAVVAPRHSHSAWPSGPKLVHSPTRFRPLCAHKSYAQTAERTPPRTAT